MLSRPSSGRAALAARHAISSPRCRRLFLESLESRDLLAILAVPTSGAIFDTASAAPHAEAANVLAELIDQGHTPVAFTDLSAVGIAAALATADAIVIPEQEFASLNAALSAAARTELAQFVGSGRGMIVLGSPDGRAESLLNGLFGFSLAAGPNPGGASLLKSEESDGTAFATAPFAIFININSVQTFDVATLPPGTRLPYQAGSVAPVGLFPYGQGQIVYLGHDFDDPGQINTANWRTLLGVAIAQVAAAPPSTAVELVGGNLVVRDLGSNNDAFVLSADNQQWVITLNTGLFTAPAAIPGVTVADKLVTIEKSLATTFSGRFVFDVGDGNDVLRVSLDDLGRDLQFDGGESAGDHDTLEVVSSSGVDSLTSTPDMSGGGTLDVGSDGDVEIVYTGLEPVDLTGTQAQELHFIVPAGITTAELKDYWESNDSLGQLAFNAAGPEDQYFRHPSQLLAVHTAGNSVVMLYPLELINTIPELLLDGAASDLFRMGSTHGILGGTSLNLVAATLDLYGQSPLINGLSGSGAITNSSNTNSLLTIGTSGNGGDFSGVISDGWPVGDTPPTTRQVSVAKLGSASQRLSGANTFSGMTEIAAGELVLDGALHLHSQVVVRSGAEFSGVGSVAGTLVAESGSELHPGSPAALPGSHLGNLESWQAGSRFAVQLGGTIPGSGHDQRRIGGGLSLAGAILDVSLFGGFVPTQQPTALTIVDNLGPAPIAGTFAGLPEGAAVNVPGSPVPLFITYQGGDGNDIVLFAAGGSNTLGTAGDDTLVLRHQSGQDDSQLEYSLNGGPFVPLGAVDSLAIDLGAGDDQVTLLGEIEVAGDLDIVAERIEIDGPLSVGGALDLTSHGLLRIDAPVVAQGQVTLTTTDQPGLDADLAIEKAVSSVSSRLVLTSADNAVIRGTLSAATTIDIAIDTSNTDPEGNALFLQGALVAPGGTTATGSADADWFEIEPQTGSSLLIVGGSPVASPIHPQSQNATSGDVAGDKLVLDMTTAGDGQSVLGPVIVDSVGGRATAQNTLAICYRGIEDLDLFDGGTLTTAQQGDIYIRGTDLDERIYVAHDGGASPLLRISVQGRMFPEDQTHYGPYVAGRSVIVYARGGVDFVDLSSAPLRGEFHGEAGNDYLAGAAYGDLLIGGPGSDTLSGGSQGGGDELWGDDFDPIPKDEDGQPIADASDAQREQNRDDWARLVSQSDGNDKLSTAGGNDRLYGQGGDDRLNPGAGDDYASGGRGNDLISGGEGNDRLFGNDGNDTLSGDGGHDLLSGGDGNDSLYGRLGNDVLIGGDGSDELKGNDGDDLLLAGIVSVRSAGAGQADATAESVVAGDAADQAMLALLVEWSTLAQATGINHVDDGELDWLYGYSGSDRFVGDGTSQNADFVAGADASGL